MDTVRSKARFAAILKERLFLRFHMSLILAGTVLAGLLASKLLLLAQVTSMTVRYPLAVVLSYLAFFGFMKLWLWYLTSNSSRADLDAGDILDIGSSVTDLPGTGIPSGGGFAGGGGSSDGAGASGSFDLTGSSAADTAAVSGDGVGQTVSDAAGEAASGLAEEGGCILIVLGILLALVFGAGIYLIYDAPFVLTEAAFEFLLAAGLLRRAKTMDRADWMGSVLKTTWKPFAVVVLLSIIAAAVLHHHDPQAVKLWEVLGK